MAAQDGLSGKPGAAASDADLARRLDSLSRELGAGKQERAAAERSASARSSANYAQAFRLSSLFVAAVLVGAALGWGLDRVAGTSPWGLIGLLLLGFCAGILNVVREAGRPPGGTAGGNGRGLG